MKLTLAERRAIYRGDYRALRRPQKPKINAGQVHVLAWTKGGKQIVDYETGATVEIPKKPTIWIVFSEPELRDGEWLVRFTAYDEREPTRMLAPTPGPPTEGGLKTRWRNPESVTKRGEEREPWTPESERGYGASARRAVDPLQAVDDEALTEFATVARARFAEHKTQERSEEVITQQSKQLMRKLRRLQGEAARHGVDMTPRLVEVIRELEREIAGKRVA